MKITELLKELDSLTYASSSYTKKSHGGGIISYYPKSDRNKVQRSFHKGELKETLKELIDQLTPKEPQLPTWGDQLALSDVGMWFWSGTECVQIQGNITTRQPVFFTKAEAYREGFLRPYLLRFRSLWLNRWEGGRYKGWGADFENGNYMFALKRASDCPKIYSTTGEYMVFPFPDAELRDQFFKTFEPQIRTYFGIDPIPDNV